MEEGKSDSLRRQDALQCLQRVGTFSLLFAKESSYALLSDEDTRPCVMKTELTRELRHHLPGEGHSAIEAFNHFLAAAASLSNVKTGTDLAPLKESFERAKQILLGAGFQYRKIDTDTFTVWPYNAIFI